MPLQHDLPALTLATLMVPAVSQPTLTKAARGKQKGAAYATPTLPLCRVGRQQQAASAVGWAHGGGRKATLGLSKRRQGTALKRPPPMEGWWETSLVPPI